MSLEVIKGAEHIHSTLLSTKFHIPAPTARAVPRQRLLTKLERGLRAKLVLISAPAGAGKSTLLATWLQQLDRPAAWLSLEHSDNDLGQFLRYLISALQQREPRVGSGLLENLQQRSPVNFESLLIQLANDLAQLENDLILVLDDYHVLADKDIHNAVEFLLDHLPSQVCIVIATRTDPPLSLSRLRVRNQLLELRGADLRFDITETTDFFNDSLGLELSAATLARLEAHTEGWIAALQLAALSLTGQADKEAFVENFAGSHRYLVDYLVDEVLSLQSPQLQRFLQRTAILARFTAPLCEAVTGQPTGADLLARLEATNLFLIPLDNERKWYRYHHLFAEFLRHRLQETEADNVRELHRRASTWFEQEGWTEEAIRHALQATDGERAAQLIDEAAAGLAMQWNNAQLIKYVGELPLEGLPRYPRLCVYYAWALTNTGQLETLARVLPIVERSQAHTLEPHTVAACVVTLRAYEHLRNLEFVLATHFCQQALNLLGEEKGSPSTEEQWGLICATNLLAYICLYSDPHQAAALYPVGLALCQTFGIMVGAANSAARLARVKHQLGQLREAEDILNQGLTALEPEREDSPERGTMVNVGELHLVLGRLHYEWNRLEEAEILIQQARRLNELSAFPPVLALELETSLRLYLARDDVRAAQASLHRLDKLRAETLPDDRLSRLNFEVMAMSGRLALAAHVPALEHLLTEVAAWVRTHHLRPEDPFEYPFEGAYSILARLMLAQNNAAEAFPLLERLALAAHIGNRKNDLIHYLLLQALALQTLGKTNEALKTLSKALDLAKSEGYCRSFVDMGPRMRALLNQLSKRPRTAYLEALLASFVQVDSEPSSAFTLAHPEASPEMVWGEPLNERERSVLRLLAVGNSYKKIAKELQLSPNTVRWYMQSLYSKLQVRNRIEAVNRGRDAGLL